MKKIIISIIFFIANITFAQTASISGKVIDQSGNSLIGANVFLEGTLKGAATDADGNFSLKGIKRGTYKLVVTMIGFEQNISEEIEITGVIDSFNVILIQTSYQYDQVVISASKYEQKIRDLPVSALFIDSERFSEKNFQTLDKALRYVSGVSVTLDQISIRGSSGYSRGAGTRVLVALDGIPIYTGDTGEIIWELIPTTEISRVEVIKGASSSMYGSTAIGGVVNVISKEITSRPLTYVNTYIGAYGNPSHEIWKWNDDLRTFYGLSLAHSRTIGNLGISASFSRIEDLGYRENDWDKKYIGYLKAKYNFSESTSLSFLGTGFTRERGTFNFWKDLDNGLSPPDDDVGQEQPSRRVILGMSLDHVFDPDFSITLKPSLYYTYWKDETESANNSKSNLYRTELRGNYKINNNSILISGLEGQFNEVTSNIFGDRTSGSFGVFSQVEYSFQIPLKLSFGIRYDYSKVDFLDGESAWSPKIGANYKLSDKTVFRTSFGKGFRAPTLAEAFTSTSASGIVVKPNPDIKSETNYSFEIGVNHILTQNFNLDAALFFSKYDNMIEPSIDPNDSKVYFGNVTEAEIQGFEINFNSNFYNQSLKLDIGYTYLWTEDIENNTFLKYRPRHQLLVKLDYTVSNLIFGSDLRYSSKVEEIDWELVEFGLVPDGDTRVDIVVLDLRGGINMFNYGFPGRLFLNLNNILNYSYVEMIGNISPIRNFSLSLELIF